MKQLTKNEALKKAQALCAKREYCKADIRQKLVQWKVSAANFDDILSSLVAEKFIDENRYVKFFVRDKFSLNKWGKIKIAYTLKAKGIAQELIQNNLDKINSEDYFDTCKYLIINKISLLKNKEKDLFKLKEKTIRFVQSRGFEADLVFKIYDSLHLNDEQ